MRFIISQTKPRPLSTPVSAGTRPAGWQVWEGWHGDAINSSGLTARPAGMPPKPPAPELADADGNGVLDAHEFLDACYRQPSEE